MLDKETDDEFRKNFPLKKNQLFVILHKNPRDLKIDFDFNQEVIDYLEDLFEGVEHLLEQKSQPR